MVHVVFVSTKFQVAEAIVLLISIYMVDLKTLWDDSLECLVNNGVDILVLHFAVFAKTHCQVISFVSSARDLFADFFRQSSAA